MINIYTGAHAWGDFDGNGWPDLFIFGLDNVNMVIKSAVYQNSNSLIFTYISITTAIADATFSWGDAQWINLDSDPELELAVCGYFAVEVHDWSQASNSFSQVYRFPQTGSGARCKWFDYNRDGLYDLLFVGGDSLGTGNGILLLAAMDPQPFSNFIDRTSLLFMDFSAPGVGFGSIEIIYLPPADGWPDIGLTTSGASRMAR